MNAKELEKKETEIQLLIEKLADESKGRYPIYDGINSIEEYLKSKYKILFILKEPYDENNGEGGGWAIRDILGKGGYGRASKTFYPLIYITYGILNNFLSFQEIPYFIQDNFDQMNNYLYKVAHINISKLPSLNSTKTNFSDIIEAYKKDKENGSIILKQIETYQPDIIVGCGINDVLFPDLEIYYDETLNLHKSKKYPNLIYIMTYHPAQTTITQQEYCDDVILRAKKWAGMKLL